MSVTVALGLQRGDEGKGRVVDLMAQTYDIVARFNGGPNAGHTISRINQEPLRLHQLPSGIAYSHTLNIIGNGTYVDPVKLLAEIESVKASGLDITPRGLVISNTAHLILPHHISLDELREVGRAGQGSTVAGIAYVGSEKYRREGVRTEMILDDLKQLQKIVYDQLVSSNRLRKAAGLKSVNATATANAWVEAAGALTPYLGDTVNILQQRLDAGSSVLAEGAQAFGLDIEHGMYPYVTSSHTTIGGALNGLGIGPQHINRVIGVIKATKSHVGGGPFVTKITNPKLADAIRGKKGEIDAEYGATTGRERQVGWLDLPELRKAINVNGVTELVITKLDAVPKCGRQVQIATQYQFRGKKLLLAPSSARQLSECKPVFEKFPTWNQNISNVRKFSELPRQAQVVVEFIADQLQTPVSMIGVGPERDQIIICNPTDSLGNLGD